MYNINQHTRLEVGMKGEGTLLSYYYSLSCATWNPNRSIPLPARTQKCLEDTPLRIGIHVLLWFCKISLSISNSQLPLTKPLYPGQPEKINPSPLMPFPKPVLTTLTVQMTKQRRYFLVSYADRLRTYYEPNKAN